MTARRRSTRLAMRLAIVSAVVAAWIGAGSLVAPRAEAQADPSNNASITLINKSGANTHMWLGHSDPVQAWIIPGGFGLWWMTLKGDRDYAGGPWYYNDKVRVNALTKGESKDKTVTREFPIRGHATGMSATWTGTDIIFQATYPADEGGARAQGTGASGQIIDMSPEDVADAMNAAIIAIIAGILTAGLGLAGTEEGAPAGMDGGEGATVPGAPAPGGPLDSGLRDPDSGDVVVGWEPGKYDPASGGGPGQVWYDGRWQPGSEAAAQIQGTLDRKAAQEAYNQQWDRAYHERNAQLDREAWMAQWRRDAEARAEREAQARAIQQLAGARTAALQRGDDEMYRRLTTGMTYRPDGSVDPEMAMRARNITIDRIVREPVEREAPSGNLITETVKNIGEDLAGKFDTLRHSLVLRVGLGFVTSGSSEVFYVPASAYDALNKAQEKALREGKDFTYADSFRTAGAAFAKERLPVNTYNLIKEKLAERDRIARGEKLPPGSGKFTFTEVAGSLFGDAMATVGMRDAGRNLGASLQMARQGGTWKQIVTARAPSLPGGAGQEPGGGLPGEPGANLPRPRNLRDIPENSPFHPGETGMSPAAARHQQWVSDVRGVNIQTRPVGQDVLKRLAEGDVPKPSTIKAKTITAEDVLLGAPGEHTGRVGFFEPKMPSTTGMSPEQIIGVQKRFLQRRNEFMELQHEMEQLTRQGTITVENGVVKHAASDRYITGDYDVYNITMKDGSAAPEWLKTQVMNDLKQPPFNAQHGAHLDWKPNPADPHYAANKEIYDKIVATHQPARPPAPGASVIEEQMANQGGVPLVTTGPGRSAPTTSLDRTGAGVR